MGHHRINLTSFIFEITKRCNHQCIFCYNVWKCPGIDYQERDELSTQEIKLMISKLINETKIRYLSLTGGEPLLREDLTEIVDYCSSNGIETNILTNGSLLNEDKCRTLLQAGVALFEVPLLTTDPNLHQHLTGRDDLTQVIQALKHIKKHRGLLITVFVATKLNIRLLKDAIELAVALDTDGMMFNRFNVGGEGISQATELLPSLPELKMALQEYNRLVGYYGVKASVAVPIPACLINPKQFKHLRFGHCPSGGKKSYYTLDPYGNVRVCNHSPTLLGNILQQDFKEILNHPFVKSFQNSYPEKCNSCKELSNCWGGCKAAAQVCSGDLKDLDPLLKANV